MPNTSPPPQLPIDRRAEQQPGEAVGREEVEARLQHGVVGGEQLHVAAEGSQLRELAVDDAVEADEGHEDGHHHHVGHAPLAALEHQEAVEAIARRGALRDGDHRGQ